MPCHKIHGFDKAGAQTLENTTGSHEYFLVVRTTELLLFLEIVRALGFGAIFFFKVIPQYNDDTEF